MSAVWEGYYEYGVEEGLALGIELGIEQGIEQGIERGITQGNEQGMNKMAVDNVTHLMKNLSIDAETAMNLLNIPDYLKVVVVQSINT